MEIIKNTIDFKFEDSTAIALGKFDGVHAGHLELINKILEQKRFGKKAVIFTFDPAPMALFSDKPIKELTTREEKRRLFEMLGIDVVVEFPMNKKTAATPPKTFVEDYLVKKLNAGFVVAGSDVSYGDRGLGDASLLQELSKVYSYELLLVDKIKYEAEEISSTLVRDKVLEGNMELVAGLCGRPYFVDGIISHGNHVGRTWEIPTINIYPEANKLLPPNGVYYSEVVIDNKRIKGMTNVGTKPTVSDVNRMSVETYLYDFDEDVYGKNATVELLTYKRPEKRFDDVEELKAQIKSDILKGREYFMLD